VRLEGSPGDRIEVGATSVAASTARHNAIEVSFGYEHVFYLNESNYSVPTNGGVEALAGSQCNPAVNVSTPTCANGNQVYRTNWPVNLGTITNSVNVFNVGLGYKF